MFLFGKLIKSPFIHLLESYSSANHLTLLPSIPLASYFRADHLILHPSVSFFCADLLTLHPSIVLESYFCAVHPLGELFSCRPFNCPIRLSLWRVIFVSSIPWGELFPCRPFNSPSFGELF